MSHFTIESLTTTEDVVNRSRFVGIAQPIISDEIFKASFEQWQNQYSDANHICFGVRILLPNGQITERFSDAGEPSGSAGKPILNHLQGRKLVNVAVFVVRYFGGIKLGVGGLVKAYGNTARQTLEESKIKEWKDFFILTMNLPYSQFSEFEHLSQEFGAIIIEKVFVEVVTVKCKIEKSSADLFKQASSRMWISCG